MKVAAIQLNSSSNKSENLAKIKYYIEQIGLTHQPDLIALPEMFTLLGGSFDTKKEAAESTQPPYGEALTLLQQLAKQYCVLIHAGSICEMIDNKFYNTTCIINPEGELITSYRKMKLFRFASSEYLQYDEASWLTAGDQVVTYPYRNHTIGCAICFDLRFGDVFQTLIKRQADMIIVPSAFTYETGKAHWEILCRARAIETQSFIIAPAQTGSYLENGIHKKTWGHSMIIDPWGNVLASLGEEEGYITAVLDFDFLRAVRQRLPVVDA